MSIIARCDCGKGFRAPANLAGKRVKCPSCGGPISIPRPTPQGDPVNLDELVRQADPLAPSPSSPLASGRPIAKGAGPNIALIAGIGGTVAVLMLGLVLVMIFVFSGGGSSPAKRTETASSPVPPESFEPVDRPLPPISPPRAAAPPEDAPPEDAPPEDERQQLPKTDTPPTPKPKTASARKFESSLNKLWGRGKKLQGVRDFDPKKPPSAQYSWMCEMLPYLGYQKVYDQFDFRVPWSHRRNLQICGHAIPEFLNPRDERLRAVGYPFDSFGITHFVGMSGVEDRRNVVAAKLPRSDPRAGIFGYSEVASPRDITDGQSQTIMIIGSGKLASPWVQGGGATIRGARRPHFDKIGGFGMKGMAEPGTVVLLADGSTRSISSKIDPAVFEAMCTMHGSESIDLSRHGRKVSHLPTRHLFDVMNKPKP